MSSVEALQAMDPATLAVAEVRARESGMSLKEWFEAMVYEHAAPAATRRHYWQGGQAGIGTRIVGAGQELATHVWPGIPYDLDAGSSLSPSSARMLTTNFDRLLSDAWSYDETSSALQLIAIFPPRINQAAILLSAAFAEAQVSDFRLPPHRPGRHKQDSDRWYSSLVETNIRCSREVRNALVHHWAPTGRAERLWSDAFATLSELSPARHELLRLFLQDRHKASVELARHLDVATQQFELSAKLLAAIEGNDAVDTDEDRFAALRATLLERAGGGLSLTDGAKLLGVSRQALHKRIKAGTALGMMNGDELVLPRLQWELTGKTALFVPGLADVVRLFADAGGWSALQFLLDPDPNLGRAPIDALREGDIAPAVAAARAYLGLDEG